MGKRPSFQWYPGDWSKDPAVQALSPEARAFWREAIDVLFESETKGQLTATKVSWARLTRVPIEWVDVFLSENNVYKTCGVTECNGTVTLMSRRILREERERELTRKRVAKHRGVTECNGTVTPMKQPSSTSSSSSSSVTKVTYTPDFESFWSCYPKERRREKGEAFGCWKARLKEGVSADDLIQAVKEYAAECGKKGTEADYIKLPASFLAKKKRPFEDYIHKPSPLDRFTEDEIRDLIREGRLKKDGDDWKLDGETLGT